MRWSSLVVALLFGCIMPEAPPTIRYFSIDEEAGATESQVSSTRDLRLRNVDAANRLRERIVWRISAVEYGFYELRRWVDPPADYLTRALERRLFETGAFRKVESGDSPVLQVELLAFDEVLEPTHEVVVALSAELTDREGRSTLMRTFEQTRPVASDDPADVARAMSDALKAAVGQLADAVEATKGP